MPLISIIMPSFNQAGFIDAAIRSVLEQRGDFDRELIVVDGGSTDGTVDMLKRWGTALRWISERDDGQADALNKGLGLARGEIIGWLNSDDLYEPGALDTVARTFAQHSQAQWIYGKVRIIDPAGREIRKSITWYKNLRMRRFSYRKLLAENWISQMGVFWRASAGREVGRFRTDLQYCMDYNYWLRLAQRWPGLFVDQYLGCFRWYPSSKSGARFGQQFREELEVAREIAAGRYRWPLFRHRLNVIKIVTAYHLMRLAGRLRGR